MTENDLPEAVGPDGEAEADEAVGASEENSPISAASDPLPPETPTTPSSIKATLQVDPKEILHANILKLMEMLEETKKELKELRKELRKEIDDGFNRIDVNLDLQREKIKEHSQRLMKYEVVAENVEGYLHQLKVDGRQSNRISLYRTQALLARSDVKVVIFALAFALAVCLGRYTAR